MSDELALRIEAIYTQALLAIAERDQLAESVAPLRARHAELVKRIADTRPNERMAALARRHGLSPAQVDFLWAAVALAIEPRLTVHAESLGGPPGRRGISVALYQRITNGDAGTGRELALWLASHNSVVDAGLLVPASDPASPAARTYQVPARVCGYLSGDDSADRFLRTFTPRDELLFDPAQEIAVASLARVLASTQALVVVEGPAGSGRTAAVANAARRPLVIGDVAGTSAAGVAEVLAALRREVELGDAVPVLAGIERAAEGVAAAIGAFLDQVPSTVVVITSQAGIAIGTSRPAIRLRWPIPDTPIRRALWMAIADQPEGDVDGLAQRYRVGPGSISRAVSSARLLHDGRLSVDAVVRGLRHNIAEELGGLATRIEVTQTWDDLVLNEDTRDQVEALIARVRHAHQVLERWKYRGKMARGTGVAALFSGAPGTGKTMVAGLIARELDLELYQVDLSQVVSKWIGETEKQLARLFDAAEQGHALLLFDEADSLFGQRTTDIKGATDRYANLEVNFLLQRVEAFGGITILTTNLDTAIDRALKRRLAAHIVFEEPDEDARIALWERLTKTGAAPLDGNIDATELARAFPKMSGANIRNAALSAAFLAAADLATTISQSHLIRAARAEYRSMGYVLSEAMR